MNKSNKRKRTMLFGARRQLQSDSSGLNFLTMVLVLAIGTSQSRAEPPIIGVDSIYPPIASAGTEVEVRVFGKNAQAVDRLHFSHSGIQASLKTLPPLPHDDLTQREFGTFLIKLDASVPTGVYEVHASGRYGVSNPRSFVVVSEPVVLLDDANSRSSVSSGTVLVGKLKKHDRISIAVNGESTRKVVCASNILDSLALPKLTLKNATGNTIRSERTIDRKPITIDSIPHEDLRFELADEIYRGGDSFVFALCADPKPDNPLQHASPLLPASALDSLGMPVWPVVDIRDREVIEPLRITPPVEVISHTTKNLQLHWNVTTAPYELQLLSHSLGHSTDFRAFAYRPVKESQALESPFQTSEDAPSVGTKGVSLKNLDPRMTIEKKDAQSEVLVSLNNLQTRSGSPGPSEVRVRIGPSIPRFECLAHWTPWTNNAATASLSGSYLPRGGQLGLHVIVHRAGGFAEAIEFSLLDPPPGISAKPTIVHASQTESEMILDSTEDAASYVGPLRVLAKSRSNGETTERVVHSATIYQGATAERGLPRSRLTSRLMLQVDDKELSPISVRCNSDSAIDVKAGEKVKLPLTAVRRAGSEAKCVLRAQYLPSKCTLPDTELAPKATEATPELTTSKETPPGEYSLCFQAEMPWKLPLYPESHNDHIAYRDRLQQKREKSTDDTQRKELDQAIGEANKRIEQLAKDTAPRDFPTFFYTANVRVRVLPP